MRSDFLMAGVDPLGMAGIDPYMGAALGLARSPNFQRVQAAAPQLAAPQASPFAPIGPADTKGLPSVPLPVDSVAAVAAGATLVIQVTPVSNVRITDFSVAATIAPNFIINSILAGRVNMFAGAGAVPAERYVANSMRPPMEVPRVPAGTIIQVSVTNISGGASRFLGVFDCLDLTYTIGR